MTNIFLFFIALTFALVGCSSNSVEDQQLNNKKMNPSIFNLNTLLTEDENDVSFPIWFNDSIIRLKKIHKITRKTFLLNSIHITPLKQLNQKIPREMREYYFNTKGSIVQLNVHYYYDDREIGSILFSYTGEKDAFGYSQVKRKTIVTKTTKRIAETHELFDPEVRELDFKMHIKRKGKKKYLAYQDMETGSFLYYMLNSEYWGVLSIDSILQPKEQDLIAWGNPKFPSKKYQIANKVNESNVKEYIYNEHQHTLPAYWLKKEYPFDYKRSFIFNQAGNCKGYIDSTFADGLYITRMISTIYFNAKKLPTKIIHKKENPSTDKKYFSIEAYFYE
ncbi:MAG: hypothetical protein HYR91_09925 [Flavobacteriia bacterium]|nr:hypothetical protein [Flavobacteriia bacterium]